MSIRLVLAEDSYLMREGIRSLLETHEDFVVVAMCNDYDSLISAVQEHSPDVVLTDIRMPPSQTDEGIRAANWIRRERPETGVVVLSQYAEPRYALSLFENGSEGRAYLLKERVADLDQLAAAIHQVVDGGSVVDPKVVDVLVEARMTQKQGVIDRLTARETEVLSEIALGKNNAAVAGALYISERAVEKHINSIFAKLDLPPADNTNRRVKAVLLYLSESANGRSG